MHRSGTPPLAAAVAAAPALILALALALTPTPAPAQDSDPLARARATLARGDAPAAAAILERALPATRGEARAPLLALLADAYEAAAAKAEADGRPDDAADYRENLAILRRKPRRTAAATPAPARPTTPPPAAIVPAAAEPEPLPIPDASFDPSPSPAPAAPAATVPVAEANAPESPAESRPLQALPSVPKVDPAVSRALASDAEPPAQPEVAPLPPPDDPAAAAVAPPVEAPRDAPAPSPTPTPAAPNAAPAPAPAPAPEAPTVEQADADFLARRYERAGAVYAELERRKQLPADRRDHWAYCRAVEVVRRINAKPATTADWAAIDAEIGAIRALSPTNWFGEYLRNRAAERNRNTAKGGTRALRPNQRVVVRGGSPEEATPAPAPAPAPAPTSPPTRPASPAPGGIVPAPGGGAPAPLPDLTPPPRAQPGPAPSSAGTGPGGSVAWSRQPIFTANFQVTHVDANRALAEEVARAAEAAREAGLKRWGDASGGLPWAPRCEIVIFPTAKEFGRETGQAPDSPGFSTMGVNNGRVVFRRLTLRADHPGTVRAVLPHEVTHVILADLFPSKPIPRWADEGLAVLAEPAAEQQARAADLDAPLATGRLFRLGDLMAMDYPEPRHWPLYYAQSVSLTRFLVEAKGGSTFLAFVKSSQEAGVESALKRTYGIAGYDDLHARWLSYARSRPRAPSALADAAESRDAALEKATRE